MFKSLRGYCSRPIVLWVVFLLLLFFLISKPVIGFPESTPTGLSSTALVMINGKTHNTIIVSERHFELKDETTILDIYGKNIELDDLPIPCTADMEYILRMDQNPVVQKVVVREVFPNSSTVFIPGK